MPADADAAAAAGAQDDAEHQVIPLGGAISGFGQGEAVGVVFHGDGAAQEAFQVRLEGVADEPGGVGILDPAASIVDGAGDADADGATLTVGHFIQCASGQRVDGIPNLFVFGRAVRITRRGHAFPEQAAAIRVQQDGLDLGAAQIDAQAVGRCPLGLLSSLRFLCLGSVNS